MGVLTKKVKGAEDILPCDSYKWQFVEDVMKQQAEVYGFKEIRTPVFEHTVLFNRGVGETTDVVQKEMYTFDTKGGESITLRPEGTAGAARAYLEHALYNDGLPVKAYYLLTCYRYEKAQAGRQREFHQFTNALREYFTQYTGQLCQTCLSRLERNPMRILDCKSEICSGIAKNAPKVLDYICTDCSAHFEKVKSFLEVADVDYTVNPTIVRGLDYYTRTVFEFVTDTIGAQGTVCGGGRYDGLIEELGGQPTPSLGFAMGIERLLLVMQAQGIELPTPKTCDLYIAALGENAEKKAFEFVRELRDSSLIAEMDIVGRGLRAQMKYADKIKAKFSMVIGDDDISANKAAVKNMSTGDKFEVPLDKGFFEVFIDKYAAMVQNGIIEAVNSISS